MRTLFTYLSTVVSLYTTACFTRIIITWFPGAERSKLGHVLGAICDPWLNLFRRFPLRLGGLDFTPMISIGILSLISSLLKNISITGRIYFGGILASVVSLVWSVFSTLGSIFLFALVIRLIVMAFSKKSTYYDSPWTRFDDSVSPIVYKLSRPFSKGKSISYRTALIVSSVMCAVLLFAGNLLVGQLVRLIVKMPI